MLIRNYGLFWDKDLVHWGHPKDTGTLLGILEGDVKSKPVDFREQTGIYALYDSAFNLIYIGQAGSGEQHLLKRLKDHRKDHLSQRWKYFSWFGLCYVKTGDDTLSAPAENPTVSNLEALNHLEAIVIAIAEPKLNLRRGNFGCEKYFQCPNK